MRPTWPSIIPLGATTCGAGAGLGDARPWRRSRAWRRCRRRRRSSSTPQWPWSVYSSTHRSAISTTSSPTSPRRSASASWTMPSGSKAPLPTASLCAGTPNSTTARTPRPASSATSLRRLSRVCCTTPGSDAIGCGSVDALAHEQRGDQVGSAHGRLGDEVAQRRRRAAGGAAGRPGTWQPSTSSYGARAPDDRRRRWRRRVGRRRRPCGDAARPGAVGDVGGAPADRDDRRGHGGRSRRRCGDAARATTPRPPSRWPAPRRRRRRAGRAARRRAASGRVA